MSQLTFETQGEIKMRYGQFEYVINIPAGVVSLSQIEPFHGKRIQVALIVLED